MVTRKHTSLTSSSNRKKITEEEVCCGNKPELSTQVYDVWENLFGIQLLSF